MEKFSGILEMSKLSEYINTIDNAITGNYTTVSYEKHFVPVLNMDGTYDINFDHALATGSVSIENFRVSDANYDGANYKIIDTNGSLSLIKVSNTNMTTVLQTNIGYVDYVLGHINLTKFRPNSIIGDFVVVKCKPQDGDKSIIASKNVILKFNEVVMQLNGVS